MIPQIIEWLEISAPMEMWIYLLATVIISLLTVWTAIASKKWKENIRKFQD